MKSRGFAWVLILIILGLLVAGGAAGYGLYAMQPKFLHKQDASNLQTQLQQQSLASQSQTQSSPSTSVQGMAQYIDPNLGFSFWYPSGWMTPHAVGGLDNSGSDLSVDLYDAQGANVGEITEAFSGDTIAGVLATTTMGGLPIYKATQQIPMTISPGIVGTSTIVFYYIPLSSSGHPQASLVFDPSTYVTGLDPLYLMRTITATDTTLDLSQRVVVQAEQEAYADQ